jgi:hypothetical protein
MQTRFNCKNRKYHLHVKVSKYNCWNIRQKIFNAYISDFDFKKNKENRKIIFAVISTAEYTKISRYIINDRNTFQFPIISLFETDEREIISNIKEKINKQEIFTDYELIELALTPIMVRGRENIIKQFKETAILMNEINYKTQKIKESTYGIALMLGNMYLDKDDQIQKEIEANLMNKGDYIIEYSEEEYNVGIDKALKEGKIEMIKSLLNDGEITVKNAINRLISLNCELESISEITCVPINEIREYQNPNEIK